MDIITEACDLLLNGRVVVIPTESVYGLAADATSDRAVALVYEIKKRPRNKPLIAHVSGLKKAEGIGHFNEAATKLAEAFWAPGTPRHRPLTIIAKLKENTGLSSLAMGGLDTVGIRVPNHAITNELLAVYPHPLAAPSANITRQISATNVDVIREYMGDLVPLIIDGGACSIGIESTIIDLSGEDAVILRPGGTTIEEISEVIGYTPRLAASTTTASPSLQGGIAMVLPLLTNQKLPGDEAGYLGFHEYDYGELNLSKSGNLDEAAANLFKMLSQLDDPTKYSEIRVAPIPTNGIGLAINERLNRVVSSRGSLR
jgi:L-threonylcarbamoyladenylate synthase